MKTIYGEQGGTKLIIIEVEEKEDFLNMTKHYLELKLLSYYVEYLVEAIEYSSVEDVSYTVLNIIA